MKKIILVCYLLSLPSLFLGQEKTNSFKAGEWLEYKMSYSGFLKAGTAKLQLEEVDLNGKKVFHATGLGETSTVIGWFFKVRDKRVVEKKVDMEKVKDQLVNSEKSKILNMHSTSHFNNLRRSISVKFFQ